MPPSADSRHAQPSAVEVELVEAEVVDGELLDGRLLDGRLLDGQLLDGELPDGDGALGNAPALAPVRTLAGAATTLPAVQAAAVAATGFVAGAATLALVRRHSARKLSRAALRRRDGNEGLPIVASRRFLVDVHLIARPGE